MHRGRAIFMKQCRSVAPSSFADSKISLGIPLKKLRQKKHPEDRPRRPQGQNQRKTIVEQSEILIQLYGGDQGKHARHHQQGDDHREKEPSPGKIDPRKRIRRQARHEQQSPAARYAHHHGIEDIFFQLRERVEQVIDIERKRRIPHRVLKLIVQLEGVPYAHGERKDHQKQQ